MGGKTVDGSEPWRVYRVEVLERSVRSLLMEFISLLFVPLTTCHEEDTHVSGDNGVVLYSNCSPLMSVMRTVAESPFFRGLPGSSSSSVFAASGESSPRSILASFSARLRRRSSVAALTPGSPSSPGAAPKRSPALADSRGLETATGSASRAMRPMLDLDGERGVVGERAGQSGAE